MTQELMDWFEQQYGKRPGIPGKNDTDLIFMIEAGDHAKVIGDAQHEWDLKLDAASKAWKQCALASSAVKYLP